MKKRMSGMIAFALCCAMLISLLPTVALAAVTAPAVISVGGIEVDPETGMGGAPTVVYGQPYSAQVVATGGELTYSAGSSGYMELPEGLSIDEQTGLISGTCTAENGRYNVYISASNTEGTAHAVVGITVGDETLVPEITTQAGSLGTAYKGAISSFKVSMDNTDGEANSVYGFGWSVKSGALPNGMTLVYADRATVYLNGTPALAGTFTFELQAENDFGADSKTFSIVVEEGSVSPNIVETGESLGYGVVGGAYEYQLEATGTNTQEDPMLWSTDSGDFSQDSYDLGNGLSMSKTGLITGTPITNQQVSFMVYAKNSVSTDSASFFILVHDNGEATSVFVSPQVAVVEKGAEKQFTVSLEGYGTVEQEAYWKFYMWDDELDAAYPQPTDSELDVDSQTPAGSATLTVGADEELSQFRVVAYSLPGNGGVLGYATVLVVEGSGEPINYYAINCVAYNSTNSDPAGTVTVEADTDSGSGSAVFATASENSSVTVNATANPGFEFVAWRKNSPTSSTNLATTTSHTFTATETVWLYAVFQKIPPTNIFTSQPSFEILALGDNGTVSFTLNENYSYQEMQLVKENGAVDDEFSAYHKGVHFTVVGNEVSAAEFKGDGTYQTPEGNYKIAVMIEGQWYYSDVFEIDYGVVPYYEISVSKTGTHFFPDQQTGYGAVEPLQVEIGNLGNQPTGDLTVTLYGDGKDNFELSKTAVPSIDVDGSATFTVAPKTGLAAGIYNAQVMVQGEHNFAKSFNVQVSVSNAPTHIITLSAPDNHTFAAAGEDYAAVTPFAVTVSSVGTGSSGELTVGLAGNNPTAFELSKTAIADIAAGDSDTFTVAPKTGLAAGAYSATVFVSGDYDIYKIFGVSFNVVGGYTVTFDANGGTGSMDQVLGVPGTWHLPACGFTAPAGMKFKAWSVSGEEYQPGNVLSISEHTTVTAVWEDIPPTYYEVTANALYVCDSPYNYSIGQNVLEGEAMTPFVLTANDGYYFPEDLQVQGAGSGITVTRDSYTQVTVSGTPTANVTVNFQPTAKQKEVIPAWSIAFEATDFDKGNLVNLEDGAAYSVTGAAEAEFTADGDTHALTGVEPGELSIVKKASNPNTRLDSDVYSCSVYRVGGVPSLYSTNCSDANNNNGSIRYVTAEMEWQKAGDNSWTTGDGGNVTGLTPGTYYVRHKASSHLLSGVSQTIHIAEYNVPALTGTITVEGEAEFGAEVSVSVTDTNNSGELSYQWKRTNTAIPGATEATYVLTEADISSTITVVVTSSVESGSLVGTLTGLVRKAPGPLAPVGLVGVMPTSAGGADGAITGTSWTMEYSTDIEFTDPEGTNCTEDRTNGLSAGTYYVRVRETGTHAAGVATMVIVPEYVSPTVTITFDANGGSGEMEPMVVEKGMTFSTPGCAFTAPAGKQFVGWDFGDSWYLTEGYQYTFYEDQILTAVWESIAYQITVTDGAATIGAGIPAETAVMGTVVTLTANAAPEGKEFDQWIVTGVAVADENSATTTFTMPAGTVTAQATYKDIPVQLGVPVITVTNRASDGKPYITWTAVDGATGYEVYRCGTSKGTYVKMYTAAANRLYVTHTGAVAGQDYFYKVRAVKDGEPGEFSAYKGVWTDLKQPTITVTNRASDGKPTISWKAVEGATGYEVYRCATSKGTYVKMYTAAANKLSVTHTGAVAGEDYFYKVKALYGGNSKCDSALSAYKGVWVDLKQPVVTVTNRASDGKPTVSWKAVEGATGYKVYRADSSNGTYKLMYTAAANKLSVTHTGAVAGEDYFYKVIATHSNSKCDSAYSAAKGVWCDLARPTLSVKLNTKGKPVLSWNEVEGATGYRIYRSTNGTSWTRMYVAPAGKLSVTHTGAAADTTYYYRMYAEYGPNAKSGSAYSTVKSITTP